MEMGRKKEIKCHGAPRWKERNRSKMERRDLEKPRDRRKKDDLALEPCQVFGGIYRSWPWLNEKESESTEMGFLRRFY